MGKDSTDWTLAVNLRAAFDILPEHVPPPKDVSELMRLTLDLCLPGLFRGTAPPVQIIRLADDGVSQWLADGVSGVTIDDLLRAIAGVTQPAARGLAMAQPATAAAFPGVKAMHVRAQYGRDLIEVQGLLVPDDTASSGFGFQHATERRGRAGPRSGWIGLPPSRKIDLPLLDPDDA